MERENNYYPCSEEKIITILLTRWTGLLSRFVCAISKYSYSHASISLDEESGVFYSFDPRGFTAERPARHNPSKGKLKRNKVPFGILIRRKMRGRNLKNRRAGSMCIRISVPKDIWIATERELRYFIDKGEVLQLSRVGIFLCFLQIPYKFKNSYTCSQFVAEILSQAGVVRLKKDASLYYPSQLVDCVEYLYNKEIFYDVF